MRSMMTVAAMLALASQAQASDAPPAYQQGCSVCHDMGVGGAPKKGDKAAWAPRIAQGKDTLYEHAIKGFKTMPPKGICPSCSDDDIKKVVDYLVSLGTQ